MKIKMLEVTTMIMWASLRGFEDVEAGNGVDTIILRGGGNGYQRVEFSEKYEIVLEPDATFEVQYDGENGDLRVKGEGREALEAALNRVLELDNEMEDY